MTDWAVQSVIFMSKTTRKQPENERKLPNYCPEKLKNPPKKGVVSKLLLCIYLTDGF